MPVENWTTFKFFFGRIAESSALRMGRKIRERKAGEKGGWEGGVNLSSESSSSFSCSKDGGRKRKKNGRKNGSVIGLFHGQINRRAEGYTNGPRPKAKISS